MINAAGGVGGQPIEYSVKDIQGDPAATQRAAQELLDDGVNAIIGPPFASTGAPLLDTVDGQVPMIYMASTDVSLADPSRGAVPRQLQRPGAVVGGRPSSSLEQGLTTAITFSSADDVYFSGNPEYFTDAFETRRRNGGPATSRSASPMPTSRPRSTRSRPSTACPRCLFTAMVMPQIQTLLEQLGAAELEMTSS